MKLLNEYLEHALTFERMAAEENDPQVRVQFEQQAMAYRRLAARTRGTIWAPAPSPPPSLRVFETESGTQTTVRHSFHGFSSLEKMPRYFFDITNGHRLVDAKGVLCDDDAAAIEAGLVIARKIAEESPKSVTRSRDYQFGWP